MTNVENLMNRRNWLVRAAILSLYSLATALSFAAGPAKIDRVVIAQGVYPVSFDPHRSIDIPSRNIHANIYDTLLVRDQKLQLAPSLAESYKRIDDNTWEFKLRKNVVFQNGEPFDAKDVKFSIDRVLSANEKSPQRGWINTVTSVQVVDNSTVRIVTNGPDPVLPARLTLIFMVPDQYVKEVGTEKFATNPVGTGPYKIGKWERGDYLDLDANPTYWGKAPIVKQARFRTIADTAARLAALRSGDVQLTTNLPADYLESIKKTAGLTVSTAPSSRVMFIALVNTKKGPLQDVRVRQAINHAVDVKAIINGVLLGYGNRSGSVNGHLLRLLGTDYKEPLYDYNPAKAKQFLAAAGYPNGFEISLDSPNGRYPMDKDISQVVASQLRQVGIKVNVKLNEWGSYAQKFTTHNTEPMYMLGWSLPSLDPDHWATPMLATGEPISNFQSEKVNKLITSARVTLDPQKRTAIYKELNNAVHEEAPWLFLFQPVDIYGVSKLISWTARSDEGLNLVDITFPN
jgi:peptide/nickel transport system substrate-binding protein